MAMTTETYGDVTVARLEDELTGDNAERFRYVLETPLEEGIRHFVIDLEKTEYLDNLGLEALDDLRTKLEDAGGQVKFSGLGPGCRKIFELTRLDQRVDIFDSLIDAVRSFQ
ncbi:MAG: STAS domain-containing protein [Planctomycetes bacterium]|nr:STAS domain-containing protein [Planctomycetota bacterium]